MAAQLAYCEQSASTCNNVTHPTGYMNQQLLFWIHMCCWKSLFCCWCTSEENRQVSITCSRFLKWLVIMWESCATNVFQPSRTFQCVVFHSLVWDGDTSRLIGVVASTKRAGSCPQTHHNWWCWNQTTDKLEATFVLFLWCSRVGCCAKLFFESPFPVSHKRSSSFRDKM